MPPKRGRGRGRGRQGQNSAPGEKTPDEPVCKEFAPSTCTPSKPKTRVLHPEELGIELKHKLTLTPSLIRRPEFGNVGRNIRLISNCFEVKMPSGYVYHYDVEIANTRRNKESEPESSVNLPPGADRRHKKYRCFSTKKNREIIKLMLDTNEKFRNLHAAYDGQKNLYTRKELANDFPLKCNVLFSDANTGNPSGLREPSEDVYQVTIKPVKKKESDMCAINLDSVHALFEKRTCSVPQDAIMALDTILRHGACLRFTPIGRSFFYPPNPEDLHPLGGGREIWFGYHQSLRLGQWKPMINLDITATTFYQKSPVLNYIAQFMNMSVDDLRRRPVISDADIKRMSKELKGIKIETNHLPYKRKYRIIRLVNESASRLEFARTVNEKAVQTTVADYFREQYNIELRFPNLPCLQVNPEKKKTYLPIEVCEVVEGQHCKKKLERKQAEDMIKFTARPPKYRFDEITEIVNKVEYSRDDRAIEFGLEVSRKPLNLEGRILDAPYIKYKNQEVKPNDGSWNLRQIQFFRGAEILSWVFISFSPPTFCTEEHLNAFSKMLIKIGRETGIKIDRQSHIKICDCRMDIKRVLNEMKTEYGAGLVVVVVPSRNKNIYADIKLAAETVVGLITQCVLDDNVRKCNPSLVSNLCQKINAKMGGVNSSLVPEEKPLIFKKPVIIIGADVNHPGPSLEIKASLSACVGSLDAFPNRYAAVCRAQTNINEKKEAVEIILDLKNMVVELLKQFYRHTNLKPEKIIFYRDGVSEGQFDKVKDHEVKCIREACRSLEEGYQPGITFIVVQKRHHTRFRPYDSRDGVGKMKNVPPGTTVDTVVTHPVNFDFFLNSQFGLQGTSCPAHYTVIEDDNDMSANDLQRLSYYLCHTSVRCTKSISVPAPVAYAHLAAYRARQLYVAQIEESSTDSSDSMGDYHALSQAQLDAIKVTDDIKNKMYFV